MEGREGQLRRSTRERGQRMGWDQSQAHQLLSYSSWYAWQLASKHTSVVGRGTDLDVLLVFIQHSLDLLDVGVESERFES